MSKSFLLYLTYNNYYNRIFKREETIKDYDYYAVNREEAVNFNPGDGVNATHIMRITADEEAENNMPDYMVELKEDKYGDFFINSRWFVIDATRTCAGQYQMELRRDVIADKWEQIKNAPMFVEKAILSENDPMIFNNENMGFNQIKKHEILLKDETNSPWIVGYVDRASTGEITVESIKPDITYNSKKLSPYYKYDINNPCPITPENLYFRHFVNTNVQEDKKTIYGRLAYGFTEDGNPGFLQEDLPKENITRFESGAVFGSDGIYSKNYLGGLSFTGPANKVRLTYEQVKNAIDFGSIISNATDDLGFVDYKVQQELISQHGKIVKINDENKIYRLEVVNKVNNQKKTKEITSTQNPKLWQNFFNAWTILKENNPSIVNKQTEQNEYSFFISYYETSSYIRWVDITEENSGKLNIDGDQNHLEDAPYDMFCIPYFDGVEIYNENNELLANNSKEYNFLLANNIIVGLDAKLYDIQLLPYCPCRDLIIQKNGKYVLKAKDKTDYAPIIKDDKNVGCILWVKKATNSFVIREEIPCINKKISNETKVHRLTSPNYGSSFDFSVAKNDGVRFWNVDFTYLPFQPYIHVCPEFGGLYGRDFDDTRGLILNGDFSLATMSNDWVSYQVQNKNYQNIFNRQIESMEFNNRFSATNDVFNIIGGTGSGAVAGAQTGFLTTKNPYGALAGAIVGGATSLTGGIVDSIRNEKVRKEAIDLTKDQFGYELGNIKARPNNLTKTTGYTANNKYFPFVEIYEATDIETEALINKIKYNGMTVMRIGKITEFLGNTFEDSKENYFKGQLIRLQLTDEEFHFVNTIANELYQGIYIPIEVR